MSEMLFGEPEPEIVPEPTKHTRRNLCSHGVDPALCIDHRKTTATEPTEETQ